MEFIRHESLLAEETRNNILNDAKNAQSYKDQSKGKNRYARRNASKLSTSVSEYNKINFDKFYKEDILDMSLSVHGETDDYIVRVSMSGVVENLKKMLQGKTEDDITQALIMRALQECFNKNDVYVWCSCKDWNYRFGYYASVNNIIAGSKETRPSDITNPDDKLGPGCKHVCLVLSNASWVRKLGSTIYNYIVWVKKEHADAYKKIVFKALFGIGYDEYQDSLDSSEEEIDKANKYAIEKNRFKQGNKEGIRFDKWSDEEKAEYYREHPDEEQDL